jgi:MFS family permease
MSLSQQRAPEAFHGWRMVALAFIAYNIGLTVVVNSFGPALPVLQHELGTSRAGISMAFAVLMLAMGVLAPVIGNVTQWVKLRTLMMMGSTLNALGFLLLAFAHNLTEVLLLYGMMIGPGVCLVALISVPTLISRWFEQDRGKALGLGLMQVFGFITAPLAGWLLSLGGGALLFLTLAGLFLALVPMLSWVIDWPESVGQVPHRAAATQAGVSAAAPVKTSQEILTDRRFWLLSGIMGILAAAGVTFASHGPAMAAAKGASLTMASVVLGATGAGALIGALGFGWLIDRIGPFRALFAAVVLTWAAWLLFAAVTSLPLLVSLAFVMGAAMGPSVALHSACMNQICGTASFGRAMGYSYFVKLPFLVGPVPLAGRLYDTSGGYGSTYIVILVGLALAAFTAISLAATSNSRALPPISLRTL